MNRRQLIKSLLISTGAVMSPSLLASITKNAHQHHKRKASAPNSAYVFKFLSPKEVNLVEVISEIIIPRTDTPGANDVGVTEFIDLMLADWYDDKDSQHFIEGLRNFNKEVTKKHNKEFLSLSVQDRINKISYLDAQVMKNKETNVSINNFYKKIKELTLIGFYTSVQGMEKELHYIGPIGEYDFAASGPPGSLTRY